MKTATRQPRTARIHPKTQKFVGEKVNNYLMKFGADTPQRIAYQLAGNPLGCCHRTAKNVPQNKSIQRNKFEGILKVLGIKFEIVDGVYKHVENEG